MKDSRIPGLYRMTIAQRIDALEQRQWLDRDTARRLKGGATVLPAGSADRMIENVIGVFGLPLAVAPNFRVNGRDYVIPMVVEEPSVVAGVSAAARLASPGGGFRVRSADPLLIGQILLIEVDDPDATVSRLQAEKSTLLAKANALQPHLEARGGGARDIEVYRTRLAQKRRDGSPPEQDAVVLHLLVDTRDAMGANLVNTMCEGLAPHVEGLAGGRVLLRILSNHATQSLVTAEATVLLSDLARDERDARLVRDSIVLATRFADANPHRAATHNKGIMNGMDAVAIATGNDWRAIEAAAHAWAAHDGTYRPLTGWSVDADGQLAGRLVLPVRAGIVGGSLRANPAVDVSLGLLGVGSARELAEIMAAVGLAQNLAALRALVTDGIQKGHMRLHARSVAASAGVPAQHFDRVVAGLVDSRDIKVRKAHELLAALASSDDAAAADAHGSAAAKIILLGEHAAVYGRHVLAVPLAEAVTASVGEQASETSIDFSDVAAATASAPDPVPAGLAEMADLIVRELGLEERHFRIRVRSRVPRAAGLGSSAAVAVAMIRAFDHLHALGLPQDAVNTLAFAGERLAHGDPSGVDNAVATYGEAILFRKDAPQPLKVLDLAEFPPLVIATSSLVSSTKEQVAAVRARRARMTTYYDAIFDEIDRLVVAGAAALETQDYTRLGSLMNLCQGLLNAIGVSTPELECMVDIARRHGAVGAKLTGAGGGGAIVALCPGSAEQVELALRNAGYRTIRPTAEDQGQ